MTAEQWQERLTECRAQLVRIDKLIARQKLIDEQGAIQGTIDLHCQGLIKCNTRILEIESELKQMEVAVMMKDELEADIRSERYHEWLDEQPKCRYCGTLWREEGGIYDENCDDYYCDQACIDGLRREEQRQRSRQFEGEGPVNFVKSRSVIGTKRV